MEHKYQYGLMYRLAFLFFAIFFFFGAHATEADNEDFKLTYNEPLPAIIETTLSPAFYIPAGLTLLTFFEDIGRNISKEAREHHQVWGDPDRASDKSDSLRTLTSISMVSSSLLFYDRGFAYMASNLAFDVGASFAAVEVRGAVRDGNRRTRPNGNDASFPSGHAAAAGARVALANYNIFHSNLNETTQYVLAGINWSIAYLVGYSRIESHNHYPEDVFAGIAIGYWTTIVLKKVFTNTASKGSPQVAVFGDSGQAGLQFTYSF